MKLCGSMLPAYCIPAVWDMIAEKRENMGGATRAVYALFGTHVLFPAATIHIYSQSSCRMLTELHVSHYTNT